VREALIYSRFVIPAQAGIQKNQGAGHRPSPVRRINQRLLRTSFFHCETLTKKVYFGKLVNNKQHVLKTILGTSIDWKILKAACQVRDKTSTSA
jgi:hypothetical protein